MKSNFVRCMEIPLVVNNSSTCANHTSGSPGQNGSNLTLTAATVLGMSRHEQNPIHCHQGCLLYGVSIFSRFKVSHKTYVE